MDVNITGFTQRQREVATVIWACQTQAQINAAITLWGVDAIIARDMLAAEVLDQEMRIDPKVVDYLANL